MCSPKLPNSQTHKQSVSIRLPSLSRARCTTRMSLGLSKVYASSLIILIRLAAVVVVPPAAAQPTPTFAQLARALGPQELERYRYEFDRTYDRDGDGLVSFAESRRVFEYLTEDDLAAYWRECDGNGGSGRALDGVLEFEEWLPCRGIYSGNGERLLETEWDSLVEEGLLSFARPEDSAEDDDDL